MMARGSFGALRLAAARPAFFSTYEYAFPSSSIFIHIYRYIHT